MNPPGLLSWAVFLACSLRPLNSAPAPGPGPSFNMPMPDAEEIALAAKPLQLDNEEDVDKLINVLTELLSDSVAFDSGNRLFFMEIPEPLAAAPPVVDETQLQANPWKRSRYYRRYPWKRQNGRDGYDSEMYLCTPSRDDVYRLLITLHDVKGGTHKPLTFCNRKRPAKTVFTNIRFLGRKK